MDFERSLNAAIAKLRQALNDSAENPRFVETLARRGYRFIAPVEVTSEDASPQPPVIAVTTPAISLGEVSSMPAPPRKSKPVLVVSPVSIAFGLASIAAFVCVYFWGFQSGGLSFRPRSQPAQTRLVRVTGGAGLAMDPAISPDGKLLAYVSDRPDGRNLNVWIQQLAPAGTAVQLTRFDSDTTQPSFSADGSRIVFRAAVNGGGLYSISSIGGEPIRIASDGRNPRLSPDGRWIAYWKGISYWTTLTGGDGGDLEVIPAGGGLPRRLAADLPSVGAPVWSPNGKHLMAFCPSGSDEVGLCVIALDGRPSRRTNIIDVLTRQGFLLSSNRVPHISQWTTGSVLFSAVYGDALNVWRMPVTDDGFSLGPAERLSSGTNLEASPLVTPTGNVIFASLNLVQSVWSLPLDANTGLVTGQITKLTEGAQPSISLDGRKLAFVLHPNARTAARDALAPSASELSKLQVSLQDLATGKADLVPDAEPPQIEPQISPDGASLAYSAGLNRRIAIFRPDAPHLVMSTQAIGKVWDWSMDQQQLLFGKPDDSGLYAYNLPLQRESLFLRNPAFNLYQARFSPDNQGVIFVACDAQRNGMDCRIFFSTLQSDGTLGKDSWIAIDHPSHWDDKPRWSPDGRLIYFVSDRDGQLCLWAQRFDTHTRRMVGKPFAIEHFHGSRLAMQNVGLGFLEIAIARNKAVLGLGELTGGLWSLQP